MSTLDVKAEPGAKIGPNSLIQTVRALKEVYGERKTFELLRKGGQGNLIEHLPGEMVDEQAFISLAKMLYETLDTKQALKILRRSGQFTAGYLLENRIPRPVQVLLKLLPDAISLKILLTAIGKNAWTFAGSGTYSFVTGKAPTITIQHSILGKALVPASETVCSYYAGTFERLLQALINPRCEVQETGCLATGSDKCTFVIKL